MCSRRPVLLALAITGGIVSCQAGADDLASGGSAYIAARVQIVRFDELSGPAVLRLRSHRFGLPHKG
jgi:hypothetical protein